MSTARTDFVERRFKAQDGVLLYFRDYPAREDPEAPAVMCLPGLTRSSKDFAALAEHLSVRHRVVCPDYRGRGRSGYDPDPGNYMPQTYVSDLKHLLAVAGLEQVVMVGTSLGGLLAMALAVAAPTALAAVILNDVGPDIAPSAIDDIIDYVSQDRPQPDFEAALAATRDRFSGFDGWDDEDLRQIAAATYRQGPDGAWHFDWDTRLAEPLRRSRPSHDLWALFAALRNLPLLVIRGARSDLMPEASLEAMAAVHPDLVAATVPGVGHAPRLTEPAALAAIEAFLGTLRDGATASRSGHVEPSSSAADDGV